MGTGALFSLMQDPWQITTCTSVFSAFNLCFPNEAAPVGSFVVLLNKNNIPTNATNKTIAKTIADAFFPITFSPSFFYVLNSIY